MSPQSLLQRLSCFSAPTLRAPPPRLPLSRVSPHRHSITWCASPAPPSPPPPLTYETTACGARVVQLARRPPGRAVESPAFTSELLRLRAMSDAFSAGVVPAALAGVDEVGVGALAGPVVAAAAVLPAGLFFEGLNDSKLVPPVRRAGLAAALRAAPGVRLAVAAVPARTVNHIGIACAGMRAMEAAAAALVRADPPQMPPLDRLLVDGDRALDATRCGMAEGAAVVAVVGGDAKCASVAAASVVAKEARDQMMAEAATLYPGYGFERNNGYGTAEHLAALSSHGPCPEHRLTCKPVRKAFEAADAGADEDGNAVAKKYSSAGEVEWVE